MRVSSDTIVRLSSIAEGSPGHCGVSSISDETQSRHWWRLMFIVTLSQSVSAVAVAGQDRMVESQLPLINWCPSGVYATPPTGLIPSTSGSPRGRPASASQNRTDESLPPLARRCPSGLNATLHTTSEWPVSV